MSAAFELYLFSTDVPLVRAAVAGGVAGVVVDWESRGKAWRQREADTEVNADTPEDLRRVRRAVDAPVVCRLNAYGPHTQDEVRAACDAGADELLLPMVRTVGEVERVLELAGGRARTGILVETRQAVAAARELARLPLARVYVGLNDLSIDRGTASIFDAVADGTVEGLRTAFTQPFGFGGLTLPEAGTPIPCALLIAEMARLRCRFSVLRRSFRRDVQGRDVRSEVARLLETVLGAMQAPPDDSSRLALRRLIGAPSPAAERP